MRKWAGIILLAVVVLFILGIVATANAEEIAGPARVLDGDTVEVTEGDRVEKVRLHGIDTAEKKQTCGVRADTCGTDATEHLTKLVGDREVKCEWSERERWGRALGTCHAKTKSGGWMKKPLNELMVMHGRAAAYLEYGSPYTERMLNAMKACRGMWADSDLPWCWRRARKGGG